MNEPFEKVLKREITEPKVKAVLDRAAAVLERVVNYGTQLVPVIDQSGRGYHDLSIITLLLHAIESLDAASILLRAGSAEPCKPVLRSMMEAVFGLDYILQDDTARRGLSYQVQHAHDRIDWYLKADGTTEQGKQFRAELKKDGTLDEWDFMQSSFDTTSEIANLQRMLTRVEFAPVEAEWQRLRAKNKRRPAWHSLFDGPAGIQQLARHVGKAGWYEILYRDFSGETHAADALSSLHGSTDGKMAYQPLRYPIEAPNLVSLAVTMAVGGYHDILNHYCSGGIVAFQRWYINDIRTDFLTVTSTLFNDAGRRVKKPVKRGGNPSDDKGGGVV
jgi:hypothetical protein